MRPVLQEGMDGGGEDAEVEPLQMGCRPGPSNTHANPLHCAPFQGTQEPQKPTSESWPPGLKTSDLDNISSHGSHGAGNRGWDEHTPAAEAAPLLTRRHRAQETSLEARRRWLTKVGPPALSLLPLQAAVTGTPPPGVAGREVPQSGPAASSLCSPKLTGLWVTCAVSFPLGLCSWPGPCA